MPALNATITTTGVISTAVQLGDYKSFVIGADENFAGTNQAV